MNINFIEDEMLTKETRYEYVVMTNEGSTTMVPFSVLECMTFAGRSFVIKAEGIDVDAKTESEVINKFISVLRENFAKL